MHAEASSSEPLSPASEHHATGSNYSEEMSVLDDYDTMSEAEESPPRPGREGHPGPASHTTHSEAWWESLVQKLCFCDSETAKERAKRLEEEAAALERERVAKCRRHAERKTKKKELHAKQQDILRQSMEHEQELEKINKEEENSNDDSGRDNDDDDDDDTYRSTSTNVLAVTLSENNLLFTPTPAEAAL